MTACERLKMAEERIEAGKWAKHALSEDNGFGGRRYCLVGALCTDAELRDVGWNGNRHVDLYRAQVEIFRTDLDISPTEITSITGLQQAYEALGFCSGHDAYTWNDAYEIRLTDVLERVSTAREKVCPKPENPDGNPEPTGA